MLLDCALTQRSQHGGLRDVEIQYDAAVLLVSSPRGLSGNATKRHLILSNDRLPLLDFVQWPAFGNLHLAPSRFATTLDHRATAALCARTRRFAFASPGADLTRLITTAATAGFTSSSRFRLPMRTTSLEASMTDTYQATQKWRPRADPAGIADAFVYQKLDIPLRLVAG
jgi:hypothetical protein